MKKHIFALFTLALIIIPAAYAGAVEYTLASPIPGGGSNQRISGFSDYARMLFPFMLSIAVIGALVMIVWGGVEYMASGGNQSRVSAAKDRITNAVYGLLLAVGSVLILGTINPALLRIELSHIPRVGNNARFDPANGTRGCGGTVQGQCPTGYSCVWHSNTNSFGCEGNMTGSIPPGCARNCSAQQQDYCSRNPDGETVCVTCDSNPGRPSCITPRL